MENQDTNSTSTSCCKTVDWQALIERVKKILFNPKEAWLAIKSEPTTVKDLYLKYIMVLAAIPAICSFLGFAVFGVGIPGVGTVRISFFPALIYQIFFYVVMLLSLGVASLALEKLAPKFEGNASYIDALKLVAYSLAPAFIAGVLNLIPLLGILSILGYFYGVYILWIGIPILVGVPESKRLAYLAVSVVVYILISIVLSVTLMAFAPDMSPNWQPPAPGSSEQFDMRKFQEGLQEMQKILPKP